MQRVYLRVWLADIDWHHIFGDLWAGDRRRLTA